MTDDYGWTAKYDQQLVSLAEGGFPLYGFQVFAFVSPSGEMNFASRVDGQGNDALVPLIGMLEIAKKDLLDALDAQEEEAE